MRLYAAATVALFLLFSQAAGVELMDEEEGIAESQGTATAAEAGAESPPPTETTTEAEGVSEPPIKLVHVLNPGEREYLSPNLIGVQNIAMSFLPLSMNFINIVDAFREITSGVRYEILLNAVDTKAENADTICRLVILEKPWLRTQWGDKHRELVNSNCTDSAENSLSSEDPAERARLLNEKYVSNSIFNGGQRNELSDSEMANLEAQILTGVGPMKRKVSLNKSGAGPAAAPTSASPLAGDPAPAAPALLVTITVSDWKPTPPGLLGPTNEATTAISIDEAAATTAATPNTEQTPPGSAANDGVAAQQQQQQEQQEEEVLVYGTTTPPATSELNDNEKRWLDDILSVGAYNFEKTIQKQQKEDSQQQEQQEQEEQHRQEEEAEETIQEEATTIIPSSAS